MYILRKKLVGQDVSFTVEYKVSSGREFGTVFLGGFMIFFLFLILST